MIKIPIFELPNKKLKRRGWWAKGFSFDRSNLNDDNVEPSIIIWKQYGLPGQKNWGGQYYGYGILPTIKNHYDFKRLLQAYIEGDFETMKKMLATDKKAVIKATFMKGEWYD
jgi:hypothetical protein